MRFTFVTRATEELSIFNRVFAPKFYWDYMINTNNVPYFINRLTRKNLATYLAGIVTFFGNFPIHWVIKTRISSIQPFTSSIIPVFITRLEIAGRVSPFHMSPITLMRTIFSGMTSFIRKGFLTLYTLPSIRIFFIMRIWHTIIVTCWDDRTSLTYT